MIDLKEHGIGASGGSNIKSIQRGQVNYGSKTELDVTISPVDMEKSIVLFSAYPSASSAITTAQGAISVQMINSTTIRFSSNTSTGLMQYIEWQVIEFDNVKSLQRGVVTNTGVNEEKTVSITEVDPSKSILFATFRTYDNGGTDFIYTLLRHRIISSTSIGFRQYGILNYHVEWQLIEFK